ncbi:hypothetical protein LPB142_16240 [Rhodobacter xanthinilyticus]|uniref:Glycosyl transferase family 1 domain-containing protein n=1 Tax=Rhodobacter xanthinilyticus TaxID=1850250 RepID=A0A1D9MFM9_9RHOB|nr:glycosyltransferase [Rhodobacter xanthinilyticus]AOZ70691.1 hypothetical protein LPB142_16240 [Rhodobacter xanthinilyticus]
MNALPRLAILTREIAAYHDARFAALAPMLPRLDVLAMADEGSFAGFLAQSLSAGYHAQRLWPGLASYRAAAENARLAPRLWQELDRIAPEVVAIAGWASPESYAALAWAKRRGRRLVVMSDSQSHDAARHPLREALKRRFLRCCDAALVAGRSHGAYLQQLGFDPGRIATGYDVVNNAHFRLGADRARARAWALRQALGLPQRYVLAAGRFVPKKNLVRLIEAFGQARAETGQDAALCIVGDGPDRPQITAAIAAQGLGEAVRLLGLRSYEDMPVLYGLAEGFAHVALTEQWGLVVNEAAAAGLPLLLSATIGAAPELLEPGRNGWLVPPDDRGAIAEGLARMLRLTADERASMAADSRARVADWGPDRFARGMVAAAHMAQTRPLRHPGPLDRILFQRMGRRPVETVA